MKNLAIKLIFPLALLIVFAAIKQPLLGLCFALTIAANIIANYYFTQSSAPSAEKNFAVKIAALAFITLGALCLIPEHSHIIFWICSAMAAFVIFVIGWISKYDQLATEISLVKQYNAIEKMQIHTSFADTFGKSPNHRKEVEEQLMVFLKQEVNSQSIVNQFIPILASLRLPIQNPQDLLEWMRNKHIEFVPNYTELGVSLRKYNKGCNRIINKTQPTNLLQAGEASSAPRGAAALQLMLKTV